MSSRIPYGLSEWIQVAANVATVAAVVYAALQFSQAAKDERISNSINVLEQGLEIQRDYDNGTIDARSVIAYYYRIYMLRQSDRVLSDFYEPLNRSMCAFMKQDPRAREYWEAADRSYWEPGFVKFVDGIERGGSCK